MKLAYFDCVAGASGDMILGALIDAGLPEATLRERLAALHLNDFSIQCQRVSKNGCSATKVDVRVANDVPERHLAEIEEIVNVSDLPLTIREQAMAIFRRLCEAEARIHSTKPDNVHLHELGGVDTIVDVVGTLVGLDALGVERVYASPLPLGRGFVRGAHGHIPLPAPATVALLKNVPIVGSKVDVETVTPTGAVLLSSLVKDFGPIPAMTLMAVGYGAGSRDLPIPNVLRLLVGTAPQTPDATRHRHKHGEEPHDHETPHSHHHDTAEGEGHSHDSHHHHEHGELPRDSGQVQALPLQEVETLVMLETNIDDLNPEFYDYVMGRLFEARALDVFLSSIQMKKNRPGTLLRILCHQDDVAALKMILFAETSTLGIRQQTITRHALARTLRHVDTPYGTVHVKIAQWAEGQVKVAPEYEDCRQLAEEHGVPLREVYSAAEHAARHLQDRH